MKKVSLCIPNYQRGDILLESFVNVIGDDRIGEVVIMDDYSNNFETINELLLGLNNDKIKIFRNTSNKGTFFNKLDVIKNATNDWCILLDSDNVISVDFLDKIYSEEWLPNKLICPEKLIHHSKNMWGKKGDFFNYNTFVGAKIDMGFCREWFKSNKELLEVLLNTGNFFVNKTSYIDAFNGNTFDRSVDVCDVAYFNYLFLKSNSDNFLKVVGGLSYDHRVHDGSFYINHAGLGPNMNNKMKELFKNSND